jgi:hypothetical protein
MDLKDKVAGWWARNDFRLLRYVLAAALLLLVVWPLRSKGVELLGKNLKDFSSIERTVMKGTPLATAQKPDGAPSGATQKLVGHEGGQTSSKTKMVVDSSSERVWAYGLQLATLIVLFGISLWTIVMLCRDE